MYIDVLIALAVVAVIGLAAGILLALASRFFGVEEDPRVKQIRECLPGANCGACGYTGCDEYAKALANGGAPNLCIPGGADTAKQLGELLGVEVSAKAAVVAFVRCNGNCEVTGKRANYEGVSSCRGAAITAGGPNSCIHGCLGHGDCAEVCPVGAICVKDGIAHIDSNVCVGCGICVSKCPKKVIELVPRDACAVVMCFNSDRGAVARQVCKNSCASCKECEKICPTGAIKIENHLANIDYDKCEGCDLCVRACPSKCIKSTDFDGVYSKLES